MPPARGVRLLAVFLLGICSGLPQALIMGSWVVRLREAGLDATTIGWLALAALPYSLNALFGPLVDGLNPVRRWWPSQQGGKAINQQVGRLAWLLLGLIFTATMALLLGLAPLQLGAGGVGLAHGARIFGLVFLLALGGAFLDVVIDALRISLLAPAEQGYGATAATYGWMAGSALVGGAFLLLLVGPLGWPGAYGAMAVVLVAVGLAAILLLVWLSKGSPATGEGAARPMASTGWGWRYLWQPIRLLGQQPNWWWLLAFIILFKAADALLGRMVPVFYLDMGLDRVAIAGLTKLPGLLGFLAGGFLGGLLLPRLGRARLLLLAGLAMGGSNLFYAGQAHWQGGEGVWVAIIFADALATGLGTTAFVAFLSGLCHPDHLATHYALLSSLANLARLQMAAASGWMLGLLEGDWVIFFSMTAAFALPGLLLLFLLRRRLA